MKKLLIALAVLLFGFSLAACDPSDEQAKPGYDYDAIPDTMEATSYDIGFVTDIGQLKDKSFNQGTWEGIKRYAHENGKSYKYYQPAGNSTDDDRYNAMAAAANAGAKIIVCAGFMQYAALVRAAAEFPEVKFVFVDGWVDTGMKNITAIIFQEEQAGYLAGYGAVKDGYTKLGFSGGGGGTNPACQRFGYGYIQGASDAAKEMGINVSMKYSWLHGQTFSASTELQGMLEGWYTTGTEVVFACGGSMCTSAFAAASANNGKVIGVDVDQAADSPTVITSALKGLREGTMIALAKFFDGKWDDIADKNVNLGALDDAIGLPTVESSWGFETWTVAEYNELYAKLKSGDIVVDANVDKHESKSFENLTLDFIQ